MTIYISLIYNQNLCIFEIGSSLPLIKKDNSDTLKSLTPKFTLRYNPTNMKNYSTASRNITADNAFSINRLGITDSFESGRSLTLGLDYKNENLIDEDKFFEFKLATVIRDKFEEDIPKSSTINRKIQIYLDQ